MKTIEKIIALQIGMCIGGIILYTLLDFRLNNIIITHILLTMGYLYGMFDARK